MHINDIQGYQYQITEDIPENGIISSKEAYEAFKELEQYKFGNPKVDFMASALMAEVNTCGWVNMGKQFASLRDGMRTRSMLNPESAMLLNSASKLERDGAAEYSADVLKEFFAIQKFLHSQMPELKAGAGNTDEGNAATVTLMRQSDDNFWGYGGELLKRVFLHYRLRMTNKPTFTQISELAQEYYHAYYTALQGYLTSWKERLGNAERNIYKYFFVGHEIDELLYTWTMHFLKTGDTSVNERSAYNRGIAGKFANLYDQEFRYITAAQDTNILRWSPELLVSDLARTLLHTNEFGYTPGFVLCFGGSLLDTLKKIPTVNLEITLISTLNAMVDVHMTSRYGIADELFREKIIKYLSELEYAGLISADLSLSLINETAAGTLLGNNILSGR
jgi:hypothetical protein